MNSHPNRAAVAQLDELPSRRCSCGITRRAFVDERGRRVSVHLLDVEDAVAHYHRIATEVYVVLDGEGFVELDGEQHPARPMSAFLIPPGVLHRAIGDMRVLVIPVPAADDTDEYYGDPGSSPERHSGDPGSPPERHSGDPGSPPERDSDE